MIELRFCGGKTYLRSKLHFGTAKTSLRSNFTAKQLHFFIGEMDVAYGKSVKLTFG